MSDEHRTPDDPDAPPSAEEEAASKRLRDALDGKAVSEDLALVSSLKAAWAPEPIDPAAHDRIVEDVPSAEELALAAELRAVLDEEPAVVVLRAAWDPKDLDPAAHRAIVDRAIGANVVQLGARTRTGTRTMRIVVATTSALALAAGFVFWVGTAPSARELPLARARSTQPLFDEPFKAGEASARIDRIALARSSDYRDNRFAKWGVR